MLSRVIGRLAIAHLLSSIGGDFSAAAALDVLPARPGRKSRQRPDQVPTVHNIRLAGV
jgi:hypothetical protein